MPFRNLCLYMDKDKASPLYEPGCATSGHSLWQNFCRSWGTHTGMDDLLYEISREPLKKKSLSYFQLLVHKMLRKFLLEPNSLKNDNESRIVRQKSNQVNIIRSCKIKMFRSLKVHVFVFIFFLPTYSV